MKKLKKENGSFIFWLVLYLINFLAILTMLFFITFTGIKMYFTSYDYLTASRIFWTTAYIYAYGVLPITFAAYWIHWLKPIFIKKNLNHWSFNFKLLVIGFSGIIIIGGLYKLLFLLLNAITFAPYELVYVFFRDISRQSTMIMISAGALLLLTIPLALIKK